MKISWWKLSNLEKARRSFILAPPLGLLFAFLSSDVMIFVFNKWEFIAVSIISFIVQGLYYKRKAEKEDQSNNAE